MDWIWAEILPLSVLAVYCLKTLLAHALAWRHLGKNNEASPLDTELPSISIIKPVRGLDQEAEQNFMSFVQSGYPAPFEVIFSVEEREDPVVPLLQRLIADCQTPARVRLIFGKRQDQRELGKTINLMAGVRESSYEVLVFSDSDVRNAAGFLERLVRPLSDARVGLSYACPVYNGARDWVAAMMSLAVNEAILALATAPPFTAIGSTMAIRKDVLHAIGGLAPLRHRIGIDAALGRAVHAKGYRIELVQQPATVIHLRSRFSEWWQQMHRWLVTIRRYLRAGHLTIPFYSAPLVWASLYFFLSLPGGNGAQGIAVLAFILVFRLASVVVVNLFFAKDPGIWRYLWLLPILELLTVVLWLESYTNPYVVWRGRRYRVLADATVRPVR